MFLRNVDDHLLDYKQSYPSRLQYEILENVFVLGLRNSVPYVLQFQSLKLIIINSKVSRDE